MYRRPWEIWNLLSYGFRPRTARRRRPLARGPEHVGALDVRPRSIELRLGRLEFLWFYLAAIIFAGLVWLGMENAWLLGTRAGRLRSPAGL